jgi:hypothetical protein
MSISKLKVTPSTVVSDGLADGAAELPDPDALVAGREADPEADPVAEPVEEVPEIWTLLVLDWEAVELLL